MHETTKMLLGRWVIQKNVAERIALQPWLCKQSSNKRNSQTKTKIALHKHSIFMRYVKSQQILKTEIKGTVLNVFFNQYTTKIKL